VEAPATLRADASLDMVHLHLIFGHIFTAPHTAVTVSFANFFSAFADVLAGQVLMPGVAYEGSRIFITLLPCCDVITMVLEHPPQP